MIAITASSSMRVNAAFFGFRSDVRAFMAVAGRGNLPALRRVTTKNPFVQRIFMRRKNPLAWAGLHDSFAPLFPNTPDLFTMSQHRSLKGAATIAAKRNVLKRFERVEVLKKRGQWKEGDKVIALRKTKPDA